MAELRSPLAGDIRDLVATKRALGFSYDAEERALARIDAWLVGQGLSERRLPRDLVERWCRRRPHESQRNQCARASAMRVLCRHLARHGLDAWVPPTGLVPKGPRYEPRIFTDDELRRLFAAVDASRPVTGSPWRHLVMPAYFRVLYTSGMRESELRLARVDDVDLGRMAVTVRGGKGRKDRVVPIHPGLAGRCADVLGAARERGDGGDGYFFTPHADGRPMTLGNVYRNFRVALERAGIPHGGRGKGPRVHDLRHTYAVNLLLRWVKEGRDPLEWLPYMSTALGHDGFEETAYYLRLTESAHPEVRRLLDRAADVIEEVAFDGREYH